MSKKAFRVFLVLLSAINFKISHGQGGGPPMLSDDSQVTELKKWEINTSLNISSGKDYNITMPTLDLNYGPAKNLQLQAEASFIGSAADRTVSGTIGDISIGVKYRFLDEEKYFVSAAIHPQALVYNSKGFLIPVFIDKAIGRFVIGQGVGYFMEPEAENSLRLGTIVGFQASVKTGADAGAFYRGR